VRSHLERAGHDVDMMIRVILIGTWYSLSDRELERRLRGFGARRLAGPHDDLPLSQCARGGGAERGHSR